MNCEREGAVSRAARTGFWPDGLRAHCDGCTACGQACAVTEALVWESARGDGGDGPIDLGQAWLEARRRSRLHLHRRALFWFRALRGITLIYFPAVLIWSLAHRGEPVSNWNLSLHADSVLSFAVVPFAVTGVLLALLCVSMGSWYLLREARTPLQGSAGR